MGDKYVSPGLIEYRKSKYRKAALEFVYQTLNKSIGQYNELADDILGSYIGKEHPDMEEYAKLEGEVKKILHAIALWHGGL